VAGRGIFLGGLLLLITTVALPWFLRSEPEPIPQITFDDLLRIDADQAPEITEATFFTIDIPKIGAKSRVIPNVDAADKFEYGQALSRGVAHAAGTYLPGMDGAVTLFAHSTDFEANVATYNAVFYRLDELNPGDLITVWYLGRKYDYRVSKTRVTSPTDVDMFKSQPGDKKLYLVTCTPRGTTKNRLIVEAEQI
jgi:sortase A